MKRIFRYVKKATKPNTPYKKGVYGEAVVDLYLQKYNYRFNDVRFDNTQIDHIVVSSKGILIIETKFHSGIIFGNEKDFYWTQVRKSKQKIQNPLNQNEYHIDKLSNRFKEYKHKMKSIIVFANPNVKLNTKIQNVILAKELNDYISSLEDIIKVENIYPIYQLLNLELYQNKR